MLNIKNKVVVAGRWILWITLPTCYFKYRVIISKMKNENTLSPSNIAMIK